MTKSFKLYAIVWAVLLVLFNVIAFVFVGLWADKYTASFWIGYVCITLCFLGQLGCSWLGLRDEGKKVFYSLPLLHAGVVGLVLSFVFGGLCMVIAPLPYWVGVILCAVVLAFNVIAVVKAKAAGDIISGIDEKVSAKTLYIRALTADAEGLMARAQSSEAKAATKKVYDALRYSDPMSHPALAEVESQITLRFSAFSDAVAANGEAVVTLAEELVILIGDRNRKCKLVK